MGRPRKKPAETAEVEIKQPAKPKGMTVKVDGAVSDGDGGWMAKGAAIDADAATLKELEAKGLVG